jgi:predicted AlkP superfamily pyrophosphatase or phosphodiesterase
MKITRLLLVAVAGLAVALGHAALHAQRAEPRHVVMISIDGMKPSVYTKPGPAKVPTLRRLAQEGVYAEGVIGVTPTVTYPSHTTLMTGVLPAVHGIYNNRILDPEDTSNGTWYWYARDIQVPTLWGAVKARGLTTAAVSWPVTVDAEIDYLMPEFAGVTAHPKWLDLTRAISHPRHLLDTFEAQGTPLAWPMTDADRTGLAAWIFRTYRPNLTLLHIFDTDTAEHTYGPGSPEALAAFEKADADVKTMVDAVAATGLADRTDIVVVSDHGFLPLQQQLQLNFAFKRAGLIDLNAAGKISRWDAYYYGAGGAGFVLLKNPDDAALRTKVAAILKEVAADPANGIQTVWTKDDLVKMGAEPRASFGIDMKDGFYTGLGHDVLVKPSASKGGHGFAPTRPDLHASLIMRGPDAGTAGNLGVVRMTQIGPTIASWFDVALSPHADTPLALAPAAHKPTSASR